MSAEATVSGRRRSKLEMPIFVDEEVPGVREFKVFRRGLVELEPRSVITDEDFAHDEPRMSETEVADAKIESVVAGKCPVREGEEEVTPNSI